LPIQSDFTVGATATTEGYGFYNDPSATTYKLPRVPNIPGGTCTVTATGTASGITASTTFKIDPELFLAAAYPWSTSNYQPPAGTWYGKPWVYSYWDGTSYFGYGWYTSIGITANSPFAFEATGLTGTAISSVSLVYSGGTMSTNLGGTLTFPVPGQTQGIGASTLPFGVNTPFGPGSPTARSVNPLTTSGKMINVTITTTGASGGSFTFTNQLFTSSPSTSYTDGTPMWVEGDSNIASDGASLSGHYSDSDELAVTGLIASSNLLIVSTVYQAGSTVQETDYDALAFNAQTLTLYDQSATGTPVSWHDADGNGVWTPTEAAYIDNNHDNLVDAGDTRLSFLSLSGTPLYPWSTVGAADPDTASTYNSLVWFPASTRPALLDWTDTATGIHHRYVYLDENADQTVSKGDIRVSTVLDASGTYAGGSLALAGYNVPMLQYASSYSDLNGFAAARVNIGVILGGGKQYDIGIWNYFVPGAPLGVKAGSTVKMTIMPYMYISTPVGYQSTKYVTEGGSVYFFAFGLFGAEPLTVSV
jgi:hypothetical protein